MNNHFCPYCNSPFSEAFITSSYKILNEVTEVFYQNSPYCDRELEVGINDKKMIVFEGRTMEESEEDLMESIYYPEGRKDEIEKPLKTKTLLYAALMAEHQGSRKKIRYQELLQTKEWETKRNQIIQRDNKRCTTCQKSGTDFHPYNMFPFSAQNWTGHFWIADFDLEQYAEYEVGHVDLMDETGFIDTRAIIIADKQYCLQVHHKHYILIDYRGNTAIKI